MHRNILKSLVALALVSSPAPILAQSTADDVEATETAQGAGLWIGAAMLAAVVAIILFHDELFDGEETDEPASP